MEGRAALGGGHGTCDGSPSIGRSLVSSNRVSLKEVVSDEGQDLRTSTLEERVQLLSEHSFLGKLPADVQTAVARLARDRAYESGSAIFRRGEPGDSMMAVMSGRVQIRVYSLDGKEITFCILETGDVFGEIALLDGKERSADAVAVEDCHLLAIDRSTFVPFLQTNPAVATELLGIVCQRVRQASDFCENIAFLDVPMRLARTFLKLADSYGRRLRDGTVRIEIKLSQRELGALIATSRESVNKQIRVWQKDGLIGMDRGYLVLHSLEKLEALASLP